MSSDTHILSESEELGTEYGELFEYEQSGEEEIKAAAAVSSSLSCSNLCCTSSKAHQPNDANLLNT